VLHQEGANVPKAGQAQPARYQHVGVSLLWKEAVVSTERVQHQSNAPVSTDGQTREAIPNATHRSVQHLVQMVVHVLGLVYAAVQYSGQDTGALYLAALVSPQQKEPAASMASAPLQRNAHAV